MRAPDELRDALEGYLRDVLSGARLVGRLERLAVERHCRDLREGAERGLEFDVRAALLACWWIEHRVRFSKGEWAGKPFLLEPWQLFVVASLFGWKRISDGRKIRRYRSAYVSVARKNGKTELAAAIALYMLTMCGETSAEVYSAATKRDQAAICWRAAASMARKSPLLGKSKTLIAHDSTYTLAHPASESRFQAVSSEANTLDGLGPYLAIVDELHAHPDRSVYDVLETGMGARREPLMLAITTAGEQRDGVCWDVESDAVKILEGMFPGDETFSYIARIDEKDDPFNASCWPKANPNLGVSVHLEGLKIAAQAAKRQPAAISEFRRKRCNQWVEMSSAWLPMHYWDQCSGEVDLDALRGRRCWIGVDLSSTSDYTAAVAVFPTQDNRPWDVVPVFFIPEETLFERQKRDRAPVVQWVRDGLVIATPGNVVDQDALKSWLVSAADRWEVIELAFDPYNATKLQTELMGLGFLVVSIRQGWASMSPAIKEAERFLKGGRIRHGGNPVLRWQFSNVALKRDSNDNLSFAKNKSTDRIDGVVALVMALHQASKSEQGEPSIWVMEA